VYGVVSNKIIEIAEITEMKVETQGSNPSSPISALS
jgi:hypothetical protein